LLNPDYYNSTSQKFDIAKAGVVSWQSPSNIALIKYWGKKAVQLPLNPSISFTLDQARTETTIRYKARESSQNWLNFSFEGKVEHSFRLRIEKYLNALKSIFPFIDQLQFDIESENSFPHSSGIASSASSMSALALCLCSIEQNIRSDMDHDEDAFRKKASFVARLGSGSACRSVYPTLAIWGKTTDFNGSDNHAAVPYHGFDPIFQDFHDDILIISGEKKSVSSTAGHKLMDSNPFAPTRYQQARTNLGEMLVAIQKGDIERFIDIAEEEALTLHALMMCSRPSYTLMKPNTVAAIEKIRDYRIQEHIPVAFTLDAGPNIHVLYPDSYAESVQSFIQSELSSLTESGLIINDRVGSGAKQLI